MKTEQGSTENQERQAALPPATGSVNVGDKYTSQSGRMVAQVVAINGELVDWEISCDGITERHTENIDTFRMLAAKTILWGGKFTPSPNVSMSYPKERSE